MDGEEEGEERTEGETESSDDEKATKSDSTATVSEEPDPITLDKVLTQAGVSKQERKTIKEELSFWWPGDLVDLSPADIITEPQYCSRTARQALYTIASQVSKHGNGSGHWNPSWDAKALMASGMYHSTFQALWQIRAKTKVSQKTGPQDEYSIPKKKINLQVVSVRPDEDWVSSREEILAELARDSRFSKLSTALSTYNYEEARATEGNNPTSYQTTNLRAWIVKCIASDIMVVSTKNRLFCDIFEDIDRTYMTLGAHLTEYVRVLFKCFKLRLELGFDNVPKFMKAATDRIETLQDIFKNLQQQFQDAPNPEWLLPFMLTYIITLEPYEDIAQEF